MTVTEHEPVWVNPADVAAHYGVQARTVWNWVKRGLTTRHPDGRIDYAQLVETLADRGPRGFRHGQRRPGHADYHAEPPRR